ncbi:MAG: MBL fold metallo-hydrolase [Dehalococcoidia bacterium]|nr:MBL fold metallo-hydrolase [Dehalococcoidia bacterium]
MAPAKVSVGNAEIISLVDTPMEFPWNLFFPNNSPADFEPYRGRYPEAFGPAGFHTNAVCYAIRSQGKTILCDTGIGPGPIAFLGGIRGRLLEDMRAKGVQPDDVDIVVHTHLHGDHVGWNLSADGAPNFPRAKYYAPQADWDFFRKALDANPQMAQVIPLHDQGRLELFSGELTLTPEVTTLPTPGHTPGHCSLLVSSGGEGALVTGDLAHHPAQVDRTEWSSGFDTDPAAAGRTRAKVCDRLEAEGLLAAFCHFPEPGFGRLVRLEGRRVFRAL